jgi:hypothetical protein
MEKTITESEFIQSFDDMNRAENFSIEGRRALFQWLNELAEMGGYSEWSLDVIGICCDYSEYKTVSEAYLNYITDGHDATLSEQLEYLNDRTFVIQFGESLGGPVIIADF